jgi:hypothetical protein
MSSTLPPSQIPPRSQTVPPYPTAGGYPKGYPQVPGYPPQTLAYASPSTAAPKPLGTMAAVAKAAVGIATLMAAVSFVTLVGQLRILQKVQAGGSVSPADAQHSDTLVAMATLAHLAALVAGAAALFTWLYRAYANLRAMGLRTESSPGATIGWWFVPFANLWKPYQLVRETAEKSGAGGGGLVGWWWACWIASGVISYLGNFGSRMPDPDLQTLIASTWADMAADVCTLAAGALLIAIISKVTAAQSSGHR